MPEDEAAGGLGTQDVERNQDLLPKRLFQNLGPLATPTGWAGTQQGLGLGAHTGCDQFLICTAWGGSPTLPGSPI